MHFQALDLIEEVEGITEPTPVFVHIDEAQEALSDHRSIVALRQMCSMLYKACSSGKNLWVTIIITGVRKLELQLHSATTCRPISLSLLSTQQSIDALRGLAPAKLAAWQPGKYLRFLLDDISGPPRLLETLMACVCGDRDQRVRVSTVVEWLLSGKVFIRLLVDRAGRRRKGSPLCIHCGAELSRVDCEGMARNIMQYVRADLKLQKPEFFRAVLASVILQQQWQLADKFAAGGFEVAFSLISAC